MKKLIFTFVLLMLGNNSSFGQVVETQIQAGLSTFRLSFPDFQTYLTSYNQVNSSGDMIDSASFNRYGAGYHVGFKFRGGPVVFGFNVGQINGFQSKATYAHDQSRSFQFRNHYFDVEFGGRFGGDKMGFIPYFTVTMNTFNLNCFYTYGDVRSYGGEKDLSGIYTSWRMLGRLGGRFEYRFAKNVGVFADISFTMNKTEYLGGEFSESNSATDSRNFKALATQDDIESITGGLKEAYRITRGVFGLQFTFGSNDDEE